MTTSPEHRRRAERLVKKIRAFMRRHEIGNRDTAVIIGTHPTSVCNWMMGHCVPQLTRGVQERQEDGTMKERIIDLEEQYRVAMRVYDVQNPVTTQADTELTEPQPKGDTLKRAADIAKVYALDVDTATKTKLLSALM